MTNTNQDSEAWSYNDITTPEHSYSRQERQDNMTGNSPVKVCIIIPTYNEAENLPRLISSIFNNDAVVTYALENINLHLLVVDDNSPDGTADVVKSYQSQNNKIHLLPRSEKNGLGAAYVAGMQHAMNTLHPDLIFEMDGDLSHHPRYIIPMINKAREGADFVVGSRYVEGGSIPDNWGLSRKIISKTANTYARTILNLKSVHDCTGGFRCMKTSVLEKIDLNALGTKGYAFQISLLEKMRQNGAVMAEVPIHFDDRTEGKSKMRIYDMAELGIFVIKARLKNIFSKSNSNYRKEKELKIVAEDD